MQTIEQREFKFKQEWLFFTLVFVIVILFWIWVGNTTNSFKIPAYSGEIQALRGANWLTMWTWVDYGDYHRYAPTGLLLAGMLDKYLLAPMLGIEFNSEAFNQATRFFPIFIVLLALTSCAIYFLSRQLGFSEFASLAVALFFGLHKGHSYSFRYMSIITLFFMMLYAVGVMYFWLKYLPNRKRIYLVGYYIFFLLLIGSWEQWVNFLAFQVCLSILMQIKSKSFDKPVFKHGILIPVLLFCTYLALRIPTIRLDATTTASEAQYVFTYPAIDLMAEEIIVNASLHTAEVISALLPIPMVSRAVIHGYDMDVLNPYNDLANDLVSKTHYLTMADWYAGIFFGAFIMVSIGLFIYAFIKQNDFIPVLTGLLLFYFGFAAHLPIMYRVYFIIPPYVGVMGYKHYFSILGFSILIGWGINKILPLVKNKISRLVMMMMILSWFVFSNYSIIKTSYQLVLRPVMFP